MQRILSKTRSFSASKMQSLFEKEKEKNPREKFTAQLLKTLEIVDEDMQLDPSNFIKHLDTISQLLHESCLVSPTQCAFLWEKLKMIFHETLERGIGKEPKSTLAVPSCASKLTVTTNIHGDEMQDHFVWLKDRNDPQVLKYIEEENQYTEQVLNESKALQKLLCDEFLSRVGDCEISPPMKLNGFTYYYRKISGKEYPLHCRIQDDVSEVQEQVYLDENLLLDCKEFEESGYFKLGMVKISSTFKYVAFASDYTGQERYTVRFRDLNTLTDLGDELYSSYTDVEFSFNDDFVFYTELDDIERAFRVKRHKIGTSEKDDVILFDEPDEMYFVTIKKTCDGRFIIINSSAQITSEIWIIDACQPEAEIRMLRERNQAIQYLGVEHHEGYFYILSNEDAKNNYIYRVKTQDWTQSETVVAHRDFVLIEEFKVKKEFLVILERSNCTQNVRIVNIRNMDDFYYIDFSSETVYSLWFNQPNEDVPYLSRIFDYNSSVLRLTYTSYTEPNQTIDFDMATKTKTIVHKETVNESAHYDESKYAAERIYVKSIDGTLIPISILYRIDLFGKTKSPSQTNHVLLHAYGAYGVNLNPMFSANRLSLLDRGFIFCVAHVRGSSALGNGWYQEGKLAKKENTFYDFCSVAEYLIKEGYTDNQKLSIYGRSAGGLLIGASINMRPDLFQSALMEVPFLDAINTMLDPSIPWTAFEYEEWGNPSEDKQVYNTMKRYCPYQNLSKTKRYPNLFVLGGMNDPRVAYFEPLRYVAKMRMLRSMAKDDGSLNENLLLLKIDNAGHGGNSGNTYLEDLASEYAFLIRTLNASDEPLTKDKSVEMYRKDAQSLFRRKFKIFSNDEKNVKKYPTKGKVLGWLKLS